LSNIVPKPCDAKVTYDNMACVECNIAELIVMTKYFPLLETRNRFANGAACVRGHGGERDVSGGWRWRRGRGLYDYTGGGGCGAHVWLCRRPRRFMRIHRIPE